MTVHTTDLVGVIVKAHAHTIADKKRAVDAGAQAHREGKHMGECPAEFLPSMGDSVLYDQWVMGFKAAIMADGCGAD